MDIKVRGWNRDMGTSSLIELDLADIKVSPDETRSVGWNRPGLFKSKGFYRSLDRVWVAWKQQLNRTGNFRMEVELKPSDVAQLFKAMFGTELDSETLKRCGLSLSPELKKQVLGEIKLSDLTIGDLAGLASAPQKETKAAPTATKSVVLRRV